MQKVEEQNFTLLPSCKRIFGVVTQARILRLCGFYLLVVLLGSALLFLTPQAYWQTLGLGLMLPGGGFLANYDLLAALLSFALFITALGVWFGTGNVIAPPLVWLISALWAASINHGTIKNHAITMIYSVIGWLWISIISLILCRFLMAHRQRSLDNAYLISQQNQLGKIFTATLADNPPEMSLEELQRLRFALDRALQPVAEFNGFEWLDQFQTAAVRYQLNFLGYGIAMTQARFTPAFAGYMDEAQINLLDKQADYRVWSYWGLENLWGNLKLNPDPVSQENIMYTGFIALQMALFTASTGRDDFSQTGRFKLIHPAGKSYAYHAAALIERLEKEYQASDFFLIACEPNWIYPLCNTIGASAILAHDAQTQQYKWQQYEQRFRYYLESEFLDAFGRYVPCRSAYTGLALPAMGGAMPLAMPSFFLNAVAPDLAIRQWLLLRRQLFDKQGNFRRNAFWRIDTGNYGFSRASAYTATALAAAELGDAEVYKNCMQALEEECPSVLKEGVIHRQQASVWAHGVEILARATDKNSFRDLLLQPRTPAGLRLEGVSYPDVLVASAHVDSTGLQAVLYSGLKDGIYEVGLAGLQQQKRYCISGALVTDIVADNQGKARVMIQLTGRTRLHIYPKGEF
jgi:hypothetical protein